MLPKNKWIFLALPLLWACSQEDSTSDLSRDELLGTWLVTEESASGPQAYQVNIGIGQGADDVFISNFYNLGTTTQARMIANGDGTLSLPSQTLPGNIMVTGSGSTNNSLSQMYLNYTADDGAQTEAVQATFTR